MRGCIVTGISTDVGKTVVSAILAKALEADYWKPIEAGGSDTKTVAHLSGVYCHPPAYQLKYPLSPHHAAKLEGVSIQKIAPLPAEPLIIEGCGGLLVPYGEGLLAPLFATWNLPWVVVSKHYLGSINHTLLTLDWLQKAGQNVLGIVFNGPPNPATEEAILTFSGLPCIGHLYPEKPLTRRKIACYAQQFKETLKPFGTPLGNTRSTPLPSLS